MGVRPAPARQIAAANLAIRHPKNRALVSHIRIHAPPGENRCGVRLLRRRRNAVDFTVYIYRLYPPPTSPRRDWNLQPQAPEPIYPPLPREGPSRLGRPLRTKRCFITFSDFLVKLRTRSDLRKAPGLGEHAAR